jgi:Fe-Mn family superoxide dismutase
MKEVRSMDNTGTYTLPTLPYGYKDLEPYISEQQLTIHHQKHHQAYVNGANAVLERLAKARKENADVDMKASLKELAFHLGGFKLHKVFWQNMAPGGKGGGGRPSGAIGQAINAEFGSFDRFKKEFSQAATAVEGSGWAALTYCVGLNRLMVAQVEKHNVNFAAGYPILMVLDVWEHAYYLDYRNDRAKFVEGFWGVVNWDFVGKQYEALAR